MRRGVRPANARTPRAIDFRRDLRAGSQFAFDQMPDVRKDLAVLLRVRHPELEPFADDLAGIADLPARFAIERSLIEYDDDFVLVANFLDVIDELVLRDDELYFGFRFRRVVAEEGAFM